MLVLQSNASSKMQFAGFILLLFSLSKAESIQYVKSNASSIGDCPGQPCLTLDQYLHDSGKYFTTGSIFVFLPGNHSLETSLNITAVSSIFFRGTENGSHAIIKCRDEITVSNVTCLDIEGITFILHFTRQESSSAFVFISSQEVVITNSAFQKEYTHSQAVGRAIFSGDSNVTINNCLFEGNTGDDGGAIFSQNGTLTITGNTFTLNQALRRGGAIYAQNGVVTLRGNNFSHNSGNISGGALYCSACNIKTMGYNTFDDNFLTGGSNSTGGAIGISGGWIIARGSASFSNNKAIVGGAISLNYTRAEFREGSFLFKENTAKYIGGGMYSNFSAIVVGTENFTFIGNIAESLGPTEVCGVLCLYVTLNATKNSITTIISATLLDNSGASGGAIFIEKTEGNVTFNNLYARGNLDGALGTIYATAKFLGTNIFLKNRKGAIFVRSTVTFDGNTKFDCNYETAITANISTVEFGGKTSIFNNFGRSGGGGISSTKSSVSFSGKTILCNNSGHVGGAMITVRGALHFSGNTNFVNNTATTYGGGLYASSTWSTIGERASVTFSFNSADSGGAIYLISNVTLTLGWYSRLETTHNIASKYGGAVFHEDVVNIIQCRNVTNIRHNVEDNLALTIPYSFLQVDQSPTNKKMCPHIISYNDSAGIDGNYLYGGLLDRSRLQDDLFLRIPYDYFTSFCNIDVSPQKNETNAIASEPFKLSTCDGDDAVKTGISVYRGQTFRLHIVALGQGKSRVPTVVTALISPNARLKLNQSSQSIVRHCSEVIYNLYSIKNYEKLTLFPEGPCQTIGQASTFLNVTFLPCPDAFNRSKEECVCEDRLKQYNATCEIEDGISIWRYKGVNFWMNALYENDSYKGLILYPSCPAEYCTADTVNISLENPDIQCAFNRSGVLCGECCANYSLLLGGSRCDLCSNIYLLLILPFALAGLALIVFLSFLRLTVATGAINSLILYANIVQANRRVFFPSSKANLLTVFIAWVNLDIGIEICFFDGMDVYAQTWLQYVFSVYVWILIILIILSSRYSITVSKLIGYDPVAVLATLLLMSYTKMLKVIIDVFSSVDLDYPNEKKVTVWLKDGNLSYLRSKHLLLSVFTLLVLVFVFLPYTIFLLLGHLLYRLRYRKYYHWLLIRIKPLLESYYAPFKAKTRYWTGFLLLVRCALYVVFSFAEAKYSLLAIIIAFSVVGSITWLTKGIYRYFYIDVIEVSVYTNLIILSAAAATLSEEAVTYVLVGIVFATAVGIVIHQIHLRYCAKSALWLKIKSKMPCYRQDSNTTTESDLSGLVKKTPEPIKAFVSRTVINLREPLLEN